MKLRTPLKRLLAQRGYVPLDRSQSDFDPEFLELYLTCKSKTMTSVERMFALYKAVEYVCRQSVPGSFVECGVWRGGSSMLAALSFLRHADLRKLYLYDTYAGMSEPAAIDVSSRGPASDRWIQAQNNDHNEWCYSSLEEVKRNLAATNYQPSRIRFVEGKVEETIPATIPEQISILRLDTDFYESTLHELRHLYPLLVRGGVLILDDYGHWEGARKAVDEYFSAGGPLLSRIDSNGRIGIRV
jgi:hypothetical protein